MTGRRAAWAAGVALAAWGLPAGAGVAWGAPPGSVCAAPGAPAERPRSPRDPADPTRAVRDALLAAQPALHRCWEQAAASDWRVAGELDVRVLVAARAPHAVEVVRDTTGRPALVACARAALAGAEIGAPFAPGDAVELPVVFRGEPHLTVRAEDVASVGGGRVLVDGQTTTGPRASLTLLEAPRGGVIALPPSLDGTRAAAVVVLGGSLLPRGGSSAGWNAGAGDVITLAYGGAGESPVPWGAREGTQLLLILTPPGPEGAFRPGPRASRGKRTAAPLLRHVAAGDPSAASLRQTLPGGIEVAPRVTTRALAVSRLSIPAGAALAHDPGAHPDSDELLYVVSGQGELFAGQDTYSLSPGTGAHVPAGVPHCFRAGAHDLLLWSVLAPAPHPHFERPTR